MAVTGVGTVCVPFVAVLWDATFNYKIGIGKIIHLQVLCSVLLSEIVILTYIFVPNNAVS